MSALGVENDDGGVAALLVRILRCREFWLGVEGGGCWSCCAGGSDVDDVAWWSLSLNEWFLSAVDVLLPMPSLRDGFIFSGKSACVAGVGARSNFEVVGVFDSLLLWSRDNE